MLRACSGLTKPRQLLIYKQLQQLTQDREVAVHPDLLTYMSTLLPKRRRPVERPHYLYEMEGPTSHPIRLPRPVCAVNAPCAASHGACTPRWPTPLC